MPDALLSRRAPTRRVRGRRPDSDRAGQWQPGSLDLLVGLAGRWLLRGLGDEFVGYPPGDAGGVGLRQAEGEVPEAGVEGFADRFPGGVGLVVGDGQVDRAGDGGGVTAGLGAVLVKQCAALGGVGDVAAGDVPQVGVLGSDAEYGG